MIVEFRTPASAPTYQQVIADLLDRHPAGKVIQKSCNDVFSLDQESSLLWYLSETLEEDASTYLREPTPELPDRELLADTVRRLITSSLLDIGEKRRLWPYGPYKDRLADALSETFGKSEPTHISTLFATFTLIALAMPWPQPALKSVVNQLLANRIGSENLRMSKMARMSYWVTVALSRGETRTEKTLAALARALKRATRIETKLWIYDLRRFEMHQQSLGLVCGTQRGILKSMLYHPDGRWGRFALGGTRFATPRIIKETIPLLRFPQIDYALRAQILLWLATVRLVDGETLELDRDIIPMLIRRILCLRTPRGDLIQSTLG